MALSWDVEARNGLQEFFTHGTYTRYSMAPTLSELWALVSRQREEDATPPDPPETQQATKPNVQPEPSTPASQPTKPSVISFPLPEPRVPYPRLSSLCEKDQRTYVQLMEKYKNVQRSGRISRKMMTHLTQYSELKNIIWNELPEFMKYLQNVARVCADDYNIICPDALHYAEEVIMAKSELVKNYPELYTVSETISIMGGKFIPDLALQLEKKLLCLGKASFLRVPTHVTLNQLSTDYKTITAFSPPSKRVAACQAEISNDENAEKLSVKYGAKVSLTSQALFTLLNNCAPNYTEPWEIPVHVKTVSGKGGALVKAVFIDSPLVKKTLTVREKNQLFYEAPLDLLMTKRYYVAVSSMTLDKPERHDIFEEKDLPSCDQRNISTCESRDFDLAADFSELETFASIVSSVASTKCADATKRASVSSTPLYSPEGGKKEASTRNSDPLEITKKIMQQKRLDFSVSKRSCDRDSTTDEMTDCEERCKSDQQKKPMQSDPEHEKECEGGTLPGTESEEVAFAKRLPSESLADSDSDCERLVIDTGFAESHVKAVQSPPKSVPEKLGCQGPKDVIPDTPRSPSPEPVSKQTLKATTPRRKRKASKPLSKELDPVGQIMKMQCELLKPSPKRQVDQPKVAQEPNPAHHQIPFDRNPTALKNSGTFGNVAGSWYATAQNTRPSLLSEELLNCSENELDYTAPPFGNATYKLFRLSDILLLVRGHVHKSQIRPRSNKGAVKKHVPICLFPKLEYQLAYGIEAFTDSEICRLWTESLLNSNAWFYIGHIDIFTSKLILIDQFPAISVAEKFGSFNPLSSLNILHNVLRKVSSLSEGKYLLSHSSGDSSITIYRSSQGGKYTRAAYNLHAAHSTLPPPPSTLSVPWVPLDPNMLLPYHIHHGRAPCAFPPRPSEEIPNQQMGVAKANRNVPAQSKPVAVETRSHPPPAQPAGTGGAAPKRKKNKGKRANRKQWWKERKMKAQGVKCQ
ncbi:little elongation complex subunit 2 isoform X2 [Chiloscyllium punctatum]|uniref:little elongation complex subunit 2 isoform X2 n=1 Tax=Chiloscyllium punctatum TaxID=137246 RepID=UPI003B6401B3